MAEKDITSQEDLLLNDPVSKKTKIYPALLIFVLLILVLLLVFFLNQHKNSLLSTQSDDPVKNSIVTSDSSICENNTKEHLLEEARNMPENICLLRILKESDMSSLATLSKSFVNLRTIYFNKTAKKIPPEIGNITSLTTLNFHHTTNTVLPPEIEKLNNLTVIHISKADIEKLPSEIGKLHNLTQLIISLNVKPVSIPSSINELPRLNVLTLRANPGISIPDLSNNQKLEYLELTDNNLEELPTGIYKLGNLLILNLSNNKISQIGPEIGNFTKLEGLRLDSNRLLSIPNLENLQSLKVLNISNNSLTRLPEGIGNLKKLTYVNVSGNKIPESEINNLKQLLPLAQIVY